jgi:hypothetical protein
MYVLLTNKNNYFVEYLLSSLILSDSIEEAMKFDDAELANKFKIMLFETCQLITSVNTFIECRKINEIH